MAEPKNSKTKTREIIKKTIYIDKELDKKIKIQSVIDEITESSLLNEILGEYFIARETDRKQ